MEWGGVRVMREAAVRALEKPRHSVHLYANRAALSLGSGQGIGTGHLGIHLANEDRVIEKQ